MQEESFGNNQQMQAKATSLFLPSLDDQNSLHNTLEVFSYSQQRELRVAPPFAAPLGPMPLVSDADGHKYRTTNNQQGSIPNHVEHKHQTQDNISNKTSDLHTNHVNDATHIPPSKAPVTPLREQDLYMPIANVVRIIRRALPPNAKVADDTKEMVQECVSEFISFITSEANENCKLDHRKTITAEDVLGAMSKLGFDQYVDPLTIYLQKYRESEILPPIPRRGIGNRGIEATVRSTANVLPPFAMVHPQFALFSTSAGNNGIYHAGSGTGTGPTTMGPNTHPATVCDGSGPSLALRIGGGLSDSEGVGPSGSHQARLDINNSYCQYK